MRGFALLYLTSGIWNSDTWGGGVEGEVEVDDEAKVEGEVGIEDGV